MFSLDFPLTGWRHNGTALHAAPNNHHWILPKCPSPLRFAGAIVRICSSRAAPANLPKIPREKKSSEYVCCVYVALPAHIPTRRRIFHPPSRKARSVRGGPDLLATGRHNVLTHVPGVAPQHAKLSGQPMPWASNLCLSYGSYQGLQCINMGAGESNQLCIH